MPEPFFRVHYFTEVKTGQRRLTWLIKQNGTVIARSHRSFRSEAELKRSLASVLRLVEQQLR